MTFEVNWDWQEENDVLELRCGFVLHPKPYIKGSETVSSFIVSFRTAHLNVHVYCFAVVRICACLPSNPVHFENHIDPRFVQNKPIALVLSFRGVLMCAFMCVRLCVCV